MTTVSSTSSTRFTATDIAPLQSHHPPQPPPATSTVTDNNHDYKDSEDASPNSKCIWFCEAWVPRATWNQWCDQYYEIQNTDHTTAIRYIDLCHNWTQIGRIGWQVYCQIDLSGSPTLSSNYNHVSVFYEMHFTWSQRCRYLAELAKFFAHDLHSVGFSLGPYGSNMHFRVNGALKSYCDDIKCIAMKHGMPLVKVAPDLAWHGTWDDAKFLDYHVTYQETW